MDHDENLQSAAKVSKFSRRSRWDRRSMENDELNITTHPDCYGSLDAINREPAFHHIIRSHSETDLYKKTPSLDFDAGHTKENIFVKENQGDTFCVVPENSRTHTNFPNTSEFINLLNNKSIDKDENKENVSNNNQNSLFYLSEENVPCNRTVIPNQDVMKHDIDYVKPIENWSKSPNIKSLSKATSQHWYSLDPDDTFLLLEKQIEENSSTPGNWKSDNNLTILNKNNEQTACKNTEFNVPNINESNDISKQILQNSMESVLKTPETLTSIALNTVHSDHDANQIISSPYCGTVYTDNNTIENQVNELYVTPDDLKSKYQSDFDKTSVECEKITPNIKTILSKASDAVSPNANDIIYEDDDSIIGRGDEIEEIFGSPRSSDSSDACDNTLEYIEHMLRYKPKNKVLHGKQVQDNNFDLAALDTFEAVARTHFNKQHDPNFHIPATTNISSPSCSSTEAKSTDCDAVPRDNIFFPFKDQLKRVKGNCSSNEMLNQNNNESDRKFCIPVIKIQPSTPPDINTLSYEAKKSKAISPNVKTDSTYIVKKSPTTSPNIKTASRYAVKKSPEISPNNIKTPSYAVKKSPTTSPNIKTASPYAVKKSSTISPHNNKTPSYAVKKSPATSPNNIKTPLYAVKKSPAVSPNIKTPSINAVKKSPVGSVKKTPNKTNMYYYIKSPVAAYIHNSPQVPLVKDVYPKKPLPSTSRMFEPVTSSKTIKACSEKDFNLPTVAYKSAKKTKVIEIPDESKLPKCQWVKEMTSSTQPMVLKHEHREFKLKDAQPTTQQDESFGNLPLIQADVSVCTQKTAMPLKKNE